MSAFRPARIVPNFAINDLVNGMVPRMMSMDRMENSGKKISPPMHIPVQAFKKNKNDVDIIYENMKSVVTLIRIMGALPITRVQPGLTKFKMASNSMIYSAIVYLALTAHVLYAMWNRIKVVVAVEGRFEEAVIAYLFIVYLMPNFLIPIFWYEAPKNAECFNHWRDFQIVPYIYVTAFINMLGAYWYMHCVIISRSANVLAQDFKHALRDNIQATTVAEYRALWLQLNRITREIGVATCYSFTILTLYLFFSLTLSIYGLFSQLQDGLTIKDVGLTISACCNIVLLHVICDQAHSASQHVRVHFQKKLLLVELSNLNPDSQTEINMFLRATEMNPSDVSLGGFFDVNRNLFKSFLGTMVTYLVVLLQFQISLPQDNNLVDNSTFNNN